MAEHNTLGILGEEKALEYMMAKGYRLKARNWYYKKKEIDIIAEDDRFLIIVEVKTRSSLFESEAQSTVTIKKQKYLVEAAAHYIEENNIQKETRFDIITVITGNGPISIEHIEDAFYPTLK